MIFRLDMLSEEEEKMVSFGIAGLCNLCLGNAMCLLELFTIQLAITCSNLTIEILEKGVKYVQS